jgi:hypothetical protein
MICSSQIDGSILFVSTLQGTQLQFTLASRIYAGGQMRLPQKELP